MTASGKWRPGALVVVMGLVLAGCSYAPAHVRPEPLIEIDGHQGGHSRHRGQNDQGENDNAQ
ncbi:hypothetical protein [Halomonas maura]|uniref:hypothetical protein n=1 Tax=Halomonas maura TaxID=117606 RepID=UPI0025B53F83|nr:hypothetical protein [Halomonas maura]MDN3556973.1 hypothetical protein [Halomonas maura]